jgi:phosphate starvation-inducible PhoH-like protein
MLASLLVSVTNWRSDLANNKRNRKPMLEQQGVIELDVYRKERNREVEILPRNLKQEQYVDLLENRKKPVVLALGPAGTGKTLLACLYAVQELKAGRCKRIIITRPAVSVDEQHGFLPGDLNQKMDPWTRPIMDVFEEYWSVKTLAYMLEEKTIEICPLAYMRGRTFKDAIILADEMQNATPSQMKMLLTRIGDRSKVVVTGDLAQHDRGYEENGLWDFVQRLEQIDSPMLGLIKFGNKEIERHPAVAEILRIYQEE